MNGLSPFAITNLLLCVFYLHHTSLMSIASFQLFVGVGCFLISICICVTLVSNRFSLSFQFVSLKHSISFFIIKNRLIFIIVLALDGFSLVGDVELDLFLATTFTPHQNILHKFLSVSLSIYHKLSHSRIYLLLWVLWILQLNVISFLLVFRTPQLPFLQPF